MTATATRERPILFSSPMVRAIMDGRKTQTRRVVKRTKAPTCDTLMRRPNAWPEGSEFFMDMADPTGPCLCCNCPFGSPGDRLWVRETWRVFGDSSVERASTSWCTGPGACEFKADFLGDKAAMDLREWRPSIHMPRWASRLTLEVVSVRVERVQSISEADAVAEGCTMPTSRLDAQSLMLRGNGMNARGAFARLWDSINAARGFGWDANPWVWVVEFRRVEQ